MRNENKAMWFISHPGSHLLTIKSFQTNVLNIFFSAINTHLKMIVPQEFFSKENGSIYNPEPIETSWHHESIVLRKNVL